MANFDPLAAEHDEVMFSFLLLAALKRAWNSPEPRGLSSTLLPAFRLANQRVEQTRG